jgi:uncharacterized membrane protein
MSLPPNNPVPQFATAEYAASGDTCKSCKQLIKGTYYRINGVLACERCTTQLQNQIPKDNHAAFVRALLFGVGAAILGLILYAAFGIITGIEIGYVSLAVGWLVGKAMRKGSNGVGGRRYQIAAAVLTYAAVSMAAIPIYISQASKQKATKPPHAQTAPSNAPSNSTDADSSRTAAGTSDNASESAGKPKINLFAALGVLGLLGLASPFLELQNPVSGAIGLVILFVGIRFAWQQTGAPKLDIVGPFQSRAPATPASS